MFAMLSLVFCRGPIHVHCLCIDLCLSSRKSFIQNGKIRKDVEKNRTMVSTLSVFSSCFKANQSVYLHIFFPRSWNSKIRVRVENRRDGSELSSCTTQDCHKIY